ncbi:MAG TPA: amino acid--tRNA ligase-related protein, partial [Patescibacteria group bacterium]|nr:amino acid--tRNA ligase-related protein [Patescibacteria group bacterium]
MSQEHKDADTTGERQDRLRKLEELKKADIDPYPSQTKRTHLSQEILNNFQDLEKKEKTVTLAGRLRSKRSHGNLSFAQLQDDQGQIQLAFSKKNIGADSYKTLSKMVDMGDFVQVSGNCFVTHKGEKSIMVSEWKLLAKAVRPLPEKWHGLKDEEEKLRKRYLDILINPEIKDMIKKRGEFWKAVRDFMVDKGFLEVETPVLEVTTGGADAQPFITHHNAMDLDVYLRISMGELWQKRLMVAGLEKTF